jgi:vesicle coat complex subunit
MLRVSYIRLKKVIDNHFRWGQVNILDALSTYYPSEQEEIEFAIESIIPRLQHVNPSVVLASIKV